MSLISRACTCTSTSSKSAKQITQSACICSGISAGVSTQQTAQDVAITEVTSLLLLLTTGLESLFRSEILALTLVLALALPLSFAVAIGLSAITCRSCRICRRRATYELCSITRSSALALLLLGLVEFLLCLVDFCLRLLLLLCSLVRVILCLLCVLLCLVLELLGLVLLLFCFLLGRVSIRERCMIEYSEIYLLRLISLLRLCFLLFSLLFCFLVCLLLGVLLRLGSLRRSVCCRELSRCIVLSGSRTYLLILRGFGLRGLIGSSLVGSSWRVSIHSRD